ncbi:ribosomal-processing cysteine protease Prp [Thermincola ferriacetica]
MINVDVFYNNLGQVIGFEAKGHGLGPDRIEKYDLICCAVSVLTITTANGITDYLQVQPAELYVDDGWLRLVLPTAPDGSLALDDLRKGQIEALLGSMVMGLEELVRNYGDYVQLKKRRWTS